MGHNTVSYRQRKFWSWRYFPQELKHMESQIKGILLYYMHCCRGSLYLAFRSPLASRPMQFLVCSVWFILQLTDISHCYYSIVLKKFSKLYLQAAVILLIHTPWKVSHFVWNSLIRVKLDSTFGHGIKHVMPQPLCTQLVCFSNKQKVYGRNATLKKNLQAGLVLRHGHIPEKCHEKLKSQKLNTKFPFKTVYFLEGGGLTTSFYVVYDYTTHRHTDL